MALSIKDPEADRLAREVARLSGESITSAVTTALRERLERLSHPPGQTLAEQLDEIAVRCAKLPVLDPRSPDEIIGYDDHGLPR